MKRISKKNKIIMILLPTVPTTAETTILLLGNAATDERRSGKMSHMKWLMTLESQSLGSSYTLCGPVAQEIFITYKNQMSAENTSEGTRPLCTTRAC